MAVARPVERGGLQAPGRAHARGPEFGQPVRNGRVQRTEARQRHAGEMLRVGRERCKERVRVGDGKDSHEAVERRRPKRRRVLADHGPAGTGARVYAHGLAGGGAQLGLGALGGDGGGRQRLDRAARHARLEASERLGQRLGHRLCAAAGHEDRQR